MTPTHPPPGGAPPAELADTLRRCRSETIDGGKHLAAIRGRYLERGDSASAGAVLLAQLHLQNAVDVLTALLAQIAEGEA